MKRTTDLCQRVFMDKLKGVLRPRLTKPQKGLILEGISLFILSIFILLSARALFRPGFYRTIDDITTVRIMYMEKELQRGNWLYNFPVRWSAELSYNFGYPLYLFYSPLVYYAGAVLMIVLKLSHIVATKWVYVFPLLVGPPIFYVMARQRLGRLPSLVASCFYTLFPFRGYDTYIRGGVGEAWAMAFFPGVLLGLFLLGKRNKWGGVLFSAFLFLVIISHHLSSLLILSFVVLYSLVFLRERLKDFLTFFLLGLGFAAFYWLPMLCYLGIVKVTYSAQNSGQILNNFYPLPALVEFGLRPKGDFIYSPLFFWILVLGGIILIFRIFTFKTKDIRRFLFWWGISFFLYFLLSPLSFVVWKITLPISRMLQFPWRVMVLLSLSLPILVGAIISGIKTEVPRWLVAFLFILAFFVYLPTFKPKAYSFFYEYRAEDSGPCATGWGDEYLPLWVKRCLGKKPSQDFVLSGGKFEILKNKIIDIELNVDLEKESAIIVNRYYFPGWRVLVDGRPVPLEYGFSKFGIFKGVIPAGEHKVRILFSKTAVMWLADLVSLASSSVLLIRASSAARIVLPEFLKQLVR